MQESLQWDEIWRNFALDKREQAAPQHRASSLHSVCTVLAIRFKIYAYVSFISLVLLLGY